MFKKLKRILGDKWLQGAFLLVLVFLFLMFLGSSFKFPDPDTFYHAKMAEFLANGELVKDFPWQQFTFLKDSFTDQHFLYHLALAPFVKFLPFPFSLKIASALFATLVALFLINQSLITPIMFKYFDFILIVMCF